MSDLIQFLKEVNPTLKMALPFFHTCTFNEATEYAEKKKILRKVCDVFNKELVYLFLGKARFIVPYIDATVQFVPISFVLKPDAKIQIYQIYPFDTGACAIGKYGSVMGKERIEEVKHKFSLGSELKIAYALITYFFKSLKHYIKESPEIYEGKVIQQIAIDSSAYQLEKINSLYGTTDTNADGRKVTVEVISNDDVDLADNADYVLVPAKNYFTNKKFKEFCKNNEVKPKIYAGNQQMASDRYYGKLLDFAENLALKYVP